MALYPLELRTAVGCLGFEGRVARSRRQLGFVKYGVRKWGDDVEPLPLITLAFLYNQGKSQKTLFGLAEWCYVLLVRLLGRP
jgi:hypothetical protein